MGMRMITVNAMVLYGQKLYERGDFNEASAVFTHVLTYDDHQALALQYLKQMGHTPIVAAPKPVVKAQPAAPKLFVPVEKTVVPERADAQGLAVDLSDTASLKAAIEAKKLVVEKLRAQVAQMRTNIASQSAQTDKGGQ